MKLWKYAILGVVTRGIMLLFFDPRKEGTEVGYYIPAGIFGLIAIWWAYNDIRQWREKKKLPEEKVNG